MKSHGRGHSDESAAAVPLLDAYLDGQLAGPARDAFEARLGRDPALAAEVELQRRLDGSLRALFVATPFPGLPSNGHPVPHNGHAAQPAASPASSNRWRWSAAAAVLVLAVGAAASWTAYKVFSDPPRRGFAEVYREQFLTGNVPDPAPPAATRATGRAAADAFAVECLRTFGQEPALPDVPAGLELQGVQAVRILSDHTVMLRARVNGDGVLVFVDRAANDDGGAAARSASGCGGGCCGVHVHRRQLGNLVLYEMTPLDEPVLIDALEFHAPAAASCSGAPGDHPLNEF